jgi:hypothetical protein
MAKASIRWLAWLPVALLVLTPVAQAGISNVIFRVEASNTAGSNAVYEVDSSQLVPDPTTGGQKWTLPAGGVELWDGTDLIAKINTATLKVVDDATNFPRILLNFEILAGTSDATFLTQSPVVSFTPVSSVLAAGKANAGFTLTDQNDGIPAVLNGLGGAGIYTAQYNGPLPSGGTVFANLVPGLTATGGATTAASDALPATGFLPIGEAVYDISLTNDFTLTANDLMSGQVAFFLTPEPTAISLLTLGLLTVVWRRR